MTDSNEVTFGEASGRKKADAALNDFVGKKISIKSFETEKRTIEDKESQIVYITLADGKVLYTWSDIIAKQLEEIKMHLNSGKTVVAEVAQKKTSQGRYLTLE